MNVTDSLSLQTHDRFEWGQCILSLGHGLICNKAQSWILSNIFSSYLIFFESFYQPFLPLFHLCFPSSPPSFLCHYYTVKVLSLLNHSYFLTLYSHHVYIGEIQSNTRFLSVSSYFHLVTVNYRRMIVMMMITDVLKRLGSVCRAATDGSKEYAIMREDIKVACCH